MLHRLLGSLSHSGSVTFCEARLPCTTILPDSCIVGDRLQGPCRDFNRWKLFLPSVVLETVGRHGLRLCPEKEGHQATSSVRNTLDFIMFLIKSLKGFNARRSNDSKYSGLKGARLDDDHEENNLLLWSKWEKRGARRRVFSNSD